MSDTLQAYCLKCKTKRDLIDPRAEFSANGSPRTVGTCAVCGTALYRLGATPAHEGMPRPEKQVKEKPAKPASKPAAKKRTATTKANGSASGKTTEAAAGKRRATKPTKQKATESAARANGKPIEKLVIVESPTKARSIGQYLGRGYTVKASRGHVRDLLVSQISVDVENDFEPKYRVPNDKRDVVSELKHDVARAQEVYLATDPDREGEAIAWHLLAATGVDSDKRVQRVVFHEITPAAVKDAFTHPRAIDMNLVNAQQARRILDRLVGYNITELLWQKVRNRLSAGRVQSIAVRIIVDREREIEAFTPREYWTLDARLQKAVINAKDAARPFIARLIAIGDTAVDFGSESDVAPHLTALETAAYTVVEVKRGERIRKPSAPFTTSTLQQEASRRLGFAARRTMAVAQQLYEGIDLPGEGSVGLITYMRTDSTAVSPSAQEEARRYIKQRFGDPYLPGKPPVYKTKAKGAQEAHEAVRPTGVFRTPESIRDALKSDQYKLYQLIWQRFVASQMENAVYNTLRVEIDARTPDSVQYRLRVSGSTIKFNGFLSLYEDARDEDNAVDDDEGRILPDLVGGDALNLLALLPEQHFTQPPPRYTEASLVRTLEEYGIGRPSTYAPTVAVIQDREYVTKQQNRLTPTDTGRIVNDLLVQYFPEVMDYQFTAKMEQQLDDISEGDREWRPMLSAFYRPFEQELKHAQEVIPSMNVDEPVGRLCPLDGGELMIKYGRFGKFIGCANYPECRHTEPWLERIGVNCPVCGEEHGGEIVEKRSRKGRIFFGCSRYPACEFTSWKRPVAHPCAKCGGLVVEQNKFRAVCTNCGTAYSVAAIKDDAETA